MEKTSKAFGALQDQTKPQYIYQPNLDGTYIVRSIVYSVESGAEFKSYVTYVDSEDKAISMIRRLQTSKPTPDT